MTLAEGILLWMCGVITGVLVYEMSGGRRDE